MGGGGSQTVNQTFNMDVLNKSIMTTITNNQQSLSAAMNNIQKVKVAVDGIKHEQSLQNRRRSKINRSN